MGMEQYLKFLEKILSEGIHKNDRTGVGTTSFFGYQMRFDLSEGFPLLTTKKIHVKSIIHELLWFVSGDTNIRYLVQNGVRIWNEWPYEAFRKSPDYRDETMEEFIGKIADDPVFALKHGDLGPIYGKQWRNFEGKDKTVDQLLEAVKSLKDNQGSRRIIISAWNPAEIEKMALPPCHTLFQFNVTGNKLDCQLYQRSADAFLGVPFNIASYALLTIMMAHVTGYEPGTFVHSLGDCHIYDNHREQVDVLLSRKPRKLPEMRIKRKVESIDGFCYDDFELSGYDPYPAVKGKVAV